MQAIRATIPVLLALLLGVFSFELAVAGSVSHSSPSQVQQIDKPAVSNTDRNLPEAKGQRLIIKYRTPVDDELKASLSRLNGATADARLRVLREFDIVAVPPGSDVQAVVSSYQQNPLVEYVSFESEVHILAAPNDPQFHRLWGLENTGQTGGTADADINAPQAWDITQGDANVVIAVIDTGIEYTHSDLSANIWTNPGEIAGDGIDNDGNGYIDDIHGIDTANDDSDPLDDHGHGTHVAGTIAGTGNNLNGVTGVSWASSVIGCKFLNAQGYGSDSDAIKCLDYLLHLKVNKGINIVATNNSWGGGGYSQALYDAIQRHHDAGILFIAAAGNDAQNNDQQPSYPASYDVPNIIAVAATDDRDQLASFSSYGQTSVDVAAPGVSIYSTVLNNSYAYYSGTSMATPHVSGLAALVKSAQPQLNMQALKALLLSSGTSVAGLADKTLTGKRIRAWDTNGSGALSCSNQSFTRLISPSSTSLINVGSSIQLQYVSFNCSTQDQTSQVTVTPGNTQITLADNGTNGDSVANDGILGGSFTLPDSNTYTLTFANGQQVQVKPLVTYSQPEEVTYNYYDIGGNLLNLGDDTSTSITSPFNLHFGGEDVGSTLYVSSNGVIGFSASTAPWRNQNLPSGSIASASIAPFWDDLFPQTANGNGVYWDVVGATPNRRLVIEWRNVQHFSQVGNTFSFQVVLYEGSSTIDMNYKDVEVGSNSLDHGASATIGVQQSLNHAVTYSYNSARIQNNTSLQWRIQGDAPAPTPPVISALDVSGEFYIGRSLTFAIQANATGDANLARYKIDFNGDGSYDYDGVSATTTHAYGQAGTYQIGVQVIDDNGLSDTYSQTIEIINLTVEEQIAEAIANRDAEIQADPSLLGLYNQTQLNQALDEQETDITTNPTEYGLISGEALLNVSKVLNLPTGWHLLSNPSEITDLSIFSGTQLVLYYQNGAYFGYSPDSDTRTRMNNSGIATFGSVPAGVGLWINK